MIEVERIMRDNPGRCLFSACGRRGRWLGEGLGERRRMRQKLKSAANTTGWAGLPVVRCKGALLDGGCAEEVPNSLIWVSTGYARQGFATVATL